MKLNFVGNLEELRKGIEIFKERFNFSTGENGILVEVKNGVGNIEVAFEDGKGKIYYRDKIHFFRGLITFMQGLKEGGNFKKIEDIHFDTVGPMFDVSRNRVLTVDSIKDYLVKLAAMGINMMMLYTEDTYTLDDYPYFGYMRGRYSHEELVECDDFADIFGIEVIPCIQTLGHLRHALKWPYASDMKDNQDILLVGEEKTYDFIESMIRASSSAVRSKRIHIGMDEAYDLGLGQYLKKHGYRRRFDIMNEHLDRVLEICDKYELQPMIWSDMYFRLGSKSGAYYDINADIPEDVKKNVPKEVDLVYWDYYNHEEDFYIDFIKEHQTFDNNIVFAGGVWTWYGPTPNFTKTYITTDPALNACKAKGVRDVIATMWGNNGGETNLFAGLPGLQLFAEHTYNEDVDKEAMKERFEFIMGVPMDAMEDLEDLDVIPGLTDYGMYERSNLPSNTNPPNPTTPLLWQDIMLGLFDKHIEGLELGKHYENVAKNLLSHRDSYPKWHYIFDLPYNIANVLAIKADIGCNMKKAYDNNDRDGLRDIKDNLLPELYKRIKALRLSHRSQWFKTNKSFGWEVLDIRYGGLLTRIDTAIERIGAYLDGSLNSIEEFEEERLYFTGERQNEKEVLGYWVHQYSRIATVNDI
ncbi:MAG: beta-N-acetylhexosaminidase [Clostridiales bacterium]|nr:beta-N-acetylhexosaminidase [Clostridiales bacterium]